MQTHVSCNKKPVLLVLLDLLLLQETLGLADLTDSEISLLLTLWSARVTARLLIRITTAWQVMLIVLLNAVPPTCQYFVCHCTDYTLMYTVNHTQMSHYSHTSSTQLWVRANSHLTVSSHANKEQRNNYNAIQYKMKPYTGWRKKRGHPISLQIFWKLHDRIAWKLVNFGNIICWTHSLTFCLKKSSHCGAT